MSVDKHETQQRLKAAIHYTVGRLCQKLGEDNRREFSRQVIAAIAETTFRQCDVFAKDLEAFARHAKRSTVSTEDVKLVARRSTALGNRNSQHHKTRDKNCREPPVKMSIYIQNKSEELNKDLKKKSTGKKKSRETEERRE